MFTALVSCAGERFGAYEIYPILTLPPGPPAAVRAPPDALRRASLAPEPPAARSEWSRRGEVGSWISYVIPASSSSKGGAAKQLSRGTLPAVQGPTQGKRSESDASATTLLRPREAPDLTISMMLQPMRCSKINIELPYKDSES